MTTIGEYAFSYCESLTSVVIPDSVTTIGKRAFANCTNLTSIEIPDSVTEIHDIFDDGDNLREVICSSNVLLSLPKNNLEKIKITSGEEIGAYAFFGCTSLTSITIPDSVTKIGGFAFSGCSGLIDVYYKGNMQSWVNITFDGTNSNPMEYAKNLYLYNEEKDEYELLIEIGNRAFYGREDLTSMLIPSSVTTIGDEAFAGCVGIREITIPNSVISIGEKAFNNCDNLTSITIPDSVTSIGKNVFNGCDGLTSISVSENNTEYASQDGILYNKEKTKIVYVPKNIWGTITLADGLQAIEDEAFAGCSRLWRIVIPDSVTKIGNNVFSGCTLSGDITFEGTSNQWEAIQKGSAWVEGISKSYIHIDCSNITLLWDLR